MTMLRKLVLVGAAAMPLALVGCNHHHHEGGAFSEQVVITEAPPVERIEVIGKAPSRDHVWARGYYIRRGTSWDWQPGHWERRPHEKAEWEHGHWEHHGSGYVFVEGRWR